MPISIIRNLLFCLLLAAPWRIYAKTANADQIKAIDSLLIESHNSLSKIDNKSALDYAELALALSESIQYSPGKAKAYFYIGQSLYTLGSFKDAVKKLALAEKEPYAASSPLIMFEICRVRGQIYKQLGLSTQSLGEFKKCLLHARKLAVPQQRDYCKSLTYENLYIFYKDLDQADSLLHYLNLNKNLLEAQDESFVFTNKINMYVSLAEYYIQQNNLDTAELLLEQSLQLAEKFEYPYTSRSYRYWGEIELAKGRPDSALVYLFKALENLEQTKIKRELYLLYDMILDIYKQQGVSDSIKSFKAKLTVCEKEMYKERIAATEYTLDTLVKTERHRLKQTQRNLLLLLGGLVLLIGIAVYLFHRQKMHGLTKKATRLKQQLSEASWDIIEEAKKGDSAFLNKFQAAYPEFTRRLSHKHPNLTHSEQLLCAMLFLNFNSKQIANYSFIEHRSVQTKRNRLRKKLKLSSSQDLYQYMQSFIK